MRFAAAALLLCAVHTAGTAAPTRYSTQGMRVDGTVCVDAATGAVLAETTADFPGSPASVTKLMTLLLVLEDVRAGRTTLRARVGVTPEAAGTGGSQIWLAVGETFSVEEMLYALMLKSANDVAVALAVDRAGGTAAFVARMNRRAAELGMTRTRFVTPNGLTYGKGPTIPRRPATSPSSPSCSVACPKPCASPRPSAMSSGARSSRWKS